MQSAMTTPHLDFWFDFSCPYAYLASTQVEALAARTGATLQPRPMLLGGVFRAVGTAQNLSVTLGPAKARHNLLDMRRHAALWQVPFEMPAGHPYRTVTALRALLAAGEPFMPLAHRFYQAYWVHGADLGDEAVVARVLRDAGHDADAVLARAASDAVKDDLRRRTDEAIALGLFGAPGCVVDGRLYWGQDRLDEVERALGGAPAALPSAAAWDGPTAPVDLWFDYSSPFSALGVLRAPALLGAALRYRPMLLGGLFRAIGQVDVPLQTMNAPRRRWVAEDLARQAAAIGFPLRWPSRFPFNTTLPLRVTLLSGAGDSPAGVRLIERLYHAAWAQDLDVSSPDVVRALCDEVGLDGATLVEAAGAPEAKAALRAATDEAVAAGVFGAPTYVVRPPAGAPQLFWGADRLELATLAARGDRRLTA